LSSIVTILNNVNNKKKIKAKDIMMTLTKEDKEDNLKDELKNAFAGLGKAIKVTEKG